MNRDDLAQLGVDVVGAGLLGWVREYSACWDRVGRVEEGLGGAGPKRDDRLWPQQLDFPR